MPLKPKTPMTASHLATIAKHIDECANHLRAVAAEIEAEKFDQVKVQTWKQMNDGMTYLDTFISAAREALKDARQERGDMPMPPVQNGRKSEPRKKASK